MHFHYLLIKMIFHSIIITEHYGFYQKNRKVMFKIRNIMRLQFSMIHCNLIINLYVNTDQIIETVVIKKKLVNLKNNFYPLQCIMYRSTLFFYIIFVLKLSYIYRNIY